MSEEQAPEITSTITAQEADLILQLGSAALRIVGLENLKFVDAVAHFKAKFTKDFAKE